MQVALHLVNRASRPTLTADAEAAARRYFVVRNALAERPDQTLAKSLGPKGEERIVAADACLPQQARGRSSRSQHQVGLLALEVFMATAGRFGML